LYTLAIGWKLEREAPEGVEDLDLCSVSMGWDVQRSQREGKKAPGMKVSPELSLATSRVSYLSSGQEVGLVLGCGRIRRVIRGTTVNGQRKRGEKDGRDAPQRKGREGGILSRRTLLMRFGLNWSG